jgi:hypothetical protein
MTVILIMALLAIMCALMLCAAESLFHLKRELKLIEKKQLQRYTNAPPTSVR